MSSEEKPKSLIGRVYHWLWGGRPLAEKKRINSLIVLCLYTVAFLYFVIYLSILNSVNRNKTGSTVKNWFGGDPPELVRLKEQQQKDIENSFKLLRKPVSGGL
jgi:hypothetical protein